MPEPGFPHWTPVFPFQSNDENQPQCNIIPSFLVQDSQSVLEFNGQDFTEYECCLIVALSFRGLSMDCIVGLLTPR